MMYRRFLTSLAVLFSFSSSYSYGIDATPNRPVTPVKKTLEQSPAETITKDTVSNVQLTQIARKDLPLGMQYPLDSLVHDWKSREYLSEGTGCQTSASNPVFPDSVIIDRLQRLPTVIELPYNDIVSNYIKRYTGSLRPQVSYMLAAFNFYGPVFEQALEAYGLPLELKYLPIIESALKPKARSRVGATGLWQFMLPTAKIYGLQVNSLVDERCDPAKSSLAAAHYLYDMYEIYHEWNLVIASYNCGPGNVNKAIRRAGGSKDFWKIYPYLPRETRGYVPAFIAANYVMNYYCEHNICPLQTAIPQPTDTIHISKLLHLQQVADKCDLPIEELRDLNPEFRRDIIPGNSQSYALRLPDMAISHFISNKDSIMAYNHDKYFTKRSTVKPSGYGSGTAGGHYIYYKIRSGDSLSTIAHKYGVGVSSLKRWNNMRTSRIRAGKHLKIYK